MSADTAQPASLVRPAAWKRSAWPGLVSAAVFVLAVLHCKKAQADAFDPADEGWEGLSGFIAVARETLGADRVLITSKLQWEALAPEDSLLIIHPTQAVDFEQCSRFLDAGGRLALLDDHGRGAELLTRFRIHRKSNPAAPEIVLRDNAQLAIALPAGEFQNRLGVSSGEPTSRHRILTDVDQVVTNHPTVLWPDPSVKVTPLLEMPLQHGKPALMALLGVIGNSERCGPNEIDPSRTRCGRLLAISDPSVFINLMLRYPGNRALAKGLFEYLAANDDQQPWTGKLRILVNDFSQTGTVSSSEPRDWLRRRMAALRELLRDIQSKGLSDTSVSVLAMLGLLGVALMTLRAVSRPPLYLPSFSRPTALVSMGGPVGRAAVLSASTTHPALVILELKTALEESLRQRLSLDRAASSAAILARARETRLLDAKSSIKLQHMLAEMNRAEAALHGGRRFSMGSGDIARLCRTVRDLLSHIDRRGVNIPGLNKPGRRET